MRRLLTSLCILAQLLVGAPASATDAPPAAYPLDAIARVLAPGTELPCKSAPPALMHYRGERLRYAKPVQIYPAFAAHLRTFEELVVELATSHYGRAPLRVVHMGGYNCREMRRYPDWVSEHALGNAIDIAGFDFAPLPRKSARFAQLPAGLRTAFKVRVDDHWRAHGALAAHADFLHALAQALAARPDIFHVVLGPGYPGHDNHLHLDYAPYRLVDFDAE